MPFKKSYIHGILNLKKYIFEKTKIAFRKKYPKTDSWNKNPKTKARTNHIPPYFMNYENEIIINDKISMIS